MALGGKRGDIFRLVLGPGAALVAAGIAAGTAGAWALTRLMSGLLYEVRPADPATFAAVGLLLALVALAAMYVPARRAARVDPDGRAALRVAHLVSAGLNPPHVLDVDSTLLR